MKSPIHTRIARYSPTQKDAEHVLQRCRSGMPGKPIRVLFVCVRNRSLRDFTRTLTRTLTRNGHMDGSQYISYVLHFSLTLSRTRTRTRTTHHVHMDGRLKAIINTKGVYLATLSFYNGFPIPSFWSLFRENHVRYQ